MCAVHKASVRGICAADYTPDEIEAWVGGLRPEGYAASMEAGQAMWVGLVDGRVRGFASLDGGEIAALYVHPEAARSGVGTRLLRAVERAAGRQGIRTLRLTSTLTALRFYQAKGYTVVDTVAFRLRGGVAIRAVEMVKELDRWRRPGKGAVS